MKESCNDTSNKLISTLPNMLSECWKPSTS